ncbi:hypothetical protein [Legionella quateirensis]|uniref:Uncharacterized protein n=1 Tax=Legionella quateirensis TaxID=45072 RepID=A0A378KW14_9GAMM|nr:hypothetical protein [Legionella quateirensis]KTD50963.1 hypothetical protein Lqua_1190 [Legionella quateirensis]STY17791.1 Uncharacterised protein [Legionella quateirensis]
MLIYFNNITYQTKPILWSFPDGSISAECVYKIAGEKDPIEHQLINVALAGIVGIEIRDGRATVSNVQEFRIRHPFNIVLPLDDPGQHQICPSSIRGTTFYRAGSDQNLPMSSSSSTSPSTSPRADLAPPPPPRTPRVRFALTFTSLLAPFSGETLVYDADAEPNILANNESNLKKLSTLGVHSIGSVNLTIQVIKNINLYFLRQHQISMAKNLFDNELIPSIQEFQNGRPLPKFVSEYFAQAVRNIMVNTSYNSKDTAFETNFIKEGIPIPIKSNYEVRAVYAREMLSSLLFFIDKSASSETGNPELDLWLQEFKAHIHLDDETVRERSLRPKNWELINKTFASLEQSIICSGLMDHDYKQLQLNDIVINGQVDFNLLVTAIRSMHEGKSTLHYALDKLDREYKLPEDSVISLPPVLKPLSMIIYSWYQTAMTQSTKAKLKEQGINELVADTIRLIQPLFLESTNGDTRTPSAKYISHTIRPNDTDMYISSAWKMALDKKFIDKTQHYGKSRKDSVKPDKLKQEIIHVIKDVLAEQLALLNNEDEQSLNQASSSNSTSYSL